VNSRHLPFVQFEEANGRFRALVSIEGVLQMEGDPEIVLAEAADLYEHYLGEMRALVSAIESLRTSRKLVPARKVWRLGNLIFEFRSRLEGLSLQIDGLYTHLVRDLGVKRKWLEKVVILRRYVPTEELIPESLNWGRCEKGTRRVVQGLLHETRQ